MKKYQKIGLVLAMGLGSASGANADILFNNTSPFTVRGGTPLSNGGWAESLFITPGSCLPTCTVDSIQLSLLAKRTSVNVNVSLTLWSADQLTQIGSLSSDSLNTFPTLLSSLKLSSFTPDSSINLLANSSYWVRLTGNDTASIQWAYTASGSRTIYDPTNIPSIGSFNGSELMTITGHITIPAAVPVPASAWLMGTALLGLFKSWRKKQA